MKTFTTQILSIAILVTLPSWASAQIFNGDLTLSTQAQVDAFNYTEVTGWLTIGSSLSDINSLQPLSKLTKVGGDLRINHNDQLQDLQGLENLINIEDGFYIENNASLTSLQGLKNLTTTGWFQIENNASLTSLQGLDNLSSIEGLHIGNNDQLKNLQGLESLTKIGGATGTVSIEGNAGLISLQGLDNLSSINNLVITDNDQLQNLKGLENLTLVPSILIYDNDQLEDLEGLDNALDNPNTEDIVIVSNPKLKSLKRLKNIIALGDLTISQNDQLQDLQGLENLTTVGSVFEIAGNVSLTSLQALANLNSIFSLVISGNDQLQDLRGLENLTVIHNVLRISGNDQLQDLQGLENLTTINGALDIEGNTELTSLQVLKNLSLVGSLTIEDNDQLQNLRGLENISSVQNITIVDNDQLEDLEGLDNALDNIAETGLLRIADNPKLTSLNKLKNITALRSLTISNNSQLQDLQGLENLTRVSREDVSITNNASLTSIEGLKNLTAIGTSLQIMNNPVLVSLQGLESLQSVRTLKMTDNTQLDDCCAIADLVSKAKGKITIKNNASNCNSVEAIQESCPPVITGFTLINATTDQDISDLELTNTPAVINILETGMHLNIRANAVGQVGSVVFALDGVIINKENVFPYALAGDEPPGDYRSWTPTLGRHTLTATPYEGKNGKGQAGEALTLEFVVVDQALAIISFTLVTTDDDQDQYELKDGSTISLQQFDPTKLNIRANTYPDEVGSVVFDLNAVKNFRTENVSPYALAGDEPPGDYKDYTFTAGTYHLTATPYARPRGRGEAGTPLSITFEVVEDPMAVARTMPATSPKTKAVAVKAEDLSAELHAEQIWVYPNPSEGLLSIRLPDTAQAVNLYLYNAQGYQVMETIGGSEGSLTLDISHLASGMYVLKVASDKMSEMHRILLK